MRDEISLSEQRDNLYMMENKFVTVKKSGETDTKIVNLGIFGNGARKRKQLKNLPETNN